jgi:hypothetical protein
LTKPINDVIFYLGIMDDTDSLARSYAARLISYDDIDRAAKEMYDIVDAVIHDETEYEKTRVFVLQIVKVIDEFDPEYNYAVAKAYYKLTKDTYGPV